MASSRKAHSRGLRLFQYRNISVQKYCRCQLRTYHISLRKQLHCRSFHRTVSHELRSAALGGARRRANIFITCSLGSVTCVFIICSYIVNLIVPRECNDKYMYSNTRCCSSPSLTYTASRGYIVGFHNKKFPPTKFLQMKYVKTIGIECVRRGGAHKSNMARLGHR